MCRLGWMCLAMNMFSCLIVVEIHVHAQNQSCSAFNMHILLQLESPQDGPES